MGESLHEDLGRATEVKGSSDRNFGFVVGGALTVLGLLPLWRGGQPRVPLLIVAAVLVVLGALRPALLRPLNRVWTALGHLMGRIVNPVVSTILFVVVFVPSALILRLSGKDLLRLEFCAADDTYWIVRDPPGPEPQTMTKQF